MALLFCDSFDHYDSARIGLKWSGSGGGVAPAIGAYGRNGTNGLRLLWSGGANAYVFKTLSVAKATLISGVAFKTVAGSGNDNDFVVLSFNDTAVGEQISVRYAYLTNKLYVSRNGTTLATGTTVLTRGVSYFIEFKSTIHNTTGAYTLRINGTQELTASSVNTRGSGTNNSGDRLTFGPTGAYGWTQDYDDLYLCDDLGADNNDFLNDVRVQVILPSAAGATSAWTPTPATNNYSRVNEATPDDDTSYVASSTVGQVDTYAMGDLTPTAGTVKGIMTSVYARKDDAGTRTIAPVIRISGTDYVQANLPNLSTTYQFLPQVVELSPATGVAFTIAEVNAMEAGVKMIA